MHTSVACWITKCMIYMAVYMCNYNRVSQSCAYTCACQWRIQDLWKGGAVGPHLRSQRKSDLIRIFMRPYGSVISGKSARASLLCFAAFCDYISIPDLPDVSLMGSVVWILTAVYWFTKIIWDFSHELNNYRKLNSSFGSPIVFAVYVVQLNPLAIRRYLQTQRRSNTSRPSHLTIHEICKC